MALPQAAADHYLQQQAIAVLAANTILAAWRRMGEDFDAGWALIQSDVLAILEAAQLAAARSAQPYLESVLYETGQVDLPVGIIQPRAFAGTASDGRPLDTLMYGAVTTAKTAVDAGLDADSALARASGWLSMTVLTQVADAGREAVSAGMASRPAVSGWVRMLNPPSCPRCVILAGKWFRWNEGFSRHPRCDCRHIPSSEQVAGDFTTDPYEAFKNLTREQQDKEFGANDARAIRDGGDIYRIVNVRNRGLATARGARLYGTPSRMTIDDIYRAAGTRTRAIAAMAEQGFITGPQVAGGNIIGNLNTDARILAAGPGRGTYRIGGVDYETARSRKYRAAMTGQRDPLDRATMTAAERRIFDAAYRVDWANRGYWPASVGANAADRGLSLSPITADQRELIAMELQAQLQGLAQQPNQVRELARRLGLI